MRKYILLLTILALSSANNENDKKNDRVEKPKRSYVCPPNFMRVSNKCYYFSNRTASWQEAYWKCRDMHSNIATIKNGNQDKILRRTMDHDGLVPLERWIGGRYDWGTKSWQWAASGKSVQYNGFGTHEIPKNKESLDWHCIYMDPTKHYKWNSRKCTEQKNYICQTKIRTVSNKDKKKIQKQYDTKLNEVPVPDIINNYVDNEINPTSNYKANAFALRPRETKLRKKKNKHDIIYRNVNGTIVEVPRRQRGKGNRLRRNKHKDNEGKNIKRKGENMRWKTYYEGTKSPYYPRVAVEEFTYS